MILYFDSYITDIPLRKDSVSDNDFIRNGNSSFRKQRKIDIAKYTLESYSIYEWSNILIKYELDNVDEYESFDKFILNIFPKAIIIHQRSDCQKKYQESINIINKFDDDLIFYAPNNDHPMILTNLEILNELIALSNKYLLTNDYVSIIYSHFSEFKNMTNRKTPFNWLFGNDCIVIENNNFAEVVLKKDGENSSVQIINKKLLNYWFNSKDLGDTRLIRSEDVMAFFKTNNQILIIPKYEICAHYDGYVHTHHYLYEIRQYQIPPLFIPSGFFAEGINIRYGYNDYKEGWVNINPALRYYSFENKKNKVDLKIAIDQIPLFWKKKIIQIDINKKINYIKLNFFIDLRNRVLNNPYSLSSKRLELNTLKYFLKIILFKFKLKFK